MAQILGPLASQSRVLAEDGGESACCCLKAMEVPEHIEILTLLTDANVFSPFELITILWIELGGFGREESGTCTVVVTFFGTVMFVSLEESGGNTVEVGTVVAGTVVAGDVCATYGDVVTGFCVTTGTVVAGADVLTGFNGGFVTG